MLIEQAYGISQSVVQGRLISHPEPVAHSTTNSLSVTLQAFSTTRVTARDGPEEKPYESIVKFVERRQELYDQELYDLPIDLHEMDVNPRSGSHFPKNLHINTYMRLIGITLFAIAEFRKTYHHLADADMRMRSPILWKPTC